MSASKEVWPRHSTASMEVCHRETCSRSASAVASSLSLFRSASSSPDNSPCSVCACVWIEGEWYRGEGGDRHRTCKPLSLWYLAYACMYVCHMMYVCMHACTEAWIGTRRAWGTRDLERGLLVLERTHLTALVLCQKSPRVSTTGDTRWLSEMAMPSFRAT